jgi:hypothetical protein
MKPSVAGLIPAPVWTQMNPFCGRQADTTFFARRIGQEPCVVVQPLQPTIA